MEWDGIHWNGAEHSGTGRNGANRKRMEHASRYSMEQHVTDLWEHCLSDPLAVGRYVGYVGRSVARSIGRFVSCSVGAGGEQ